MRLIQNMQMQVGEVDVAQIQFDPKSRDDVPKILKGLQHIYVTEALRSKIFALLETQIAPAVDKRNGRPSMTLWRILVCGCSCVIHCGRLFGFGHGRHGV